MIKKDEIKETKRILINIENIENIGDIYKYINAPVFCLANDLPFDEDTKFYVNDKKYTASLDACQSIMPKGWRANMSYSKARLDYKVILFKNGAPKIASDHYETLPLAWLSAILLTYIWEWENE